MRIKGIVVEYDNYVGKIKSNNKLYIFTNSDLVDKVSINDKVSFIGEVFQTVEILEYRARFIKVCKE